MPIKKTIVRNKKTIGLRLQVFYGGTYAPEDGITVIKYVNQVTYRF